MRRWWLPYRTQRSALVAAVGLLGVGAIVGLAHHWHPVLVMVLGLAAAAVAGLIDRWRERRR